MSSLGASLRAPGRSRLPFGEDRFSRILWTHWHRTATLQCQALRRERLRVEPEPIRERERLGEALDEVGEPEIHVEDHMMRGMIGIYRVSP